MARFTTLRVLDADEILRIHGASLGILERIGVRVPHEPMRGLFARAGASVAQDGLVRIPPALVESSIAASPKRFVLRGRDPSRVARFGYGERNYNSIAGEALWLDWKTGARRPPTLADVAEAARVGDALERITMPGAMADPADVPVSVRCIEVARELLEGPQSP